MSRKMVNIASDPEDTRRAPSSADHVGKVFIALGHGMRRCLICNDVFTLHGAARHAEVVCYPN
jgi:hypothetical protein